MNWQHKTILDVCVIDLINDAIHDKKNKHARKYLSYFMLHGTYSGKKAAFGGGVNTSSFETILVVIDLHKAIAPQFIPDFEAEK